MKVKAYFKIKKIVVDADKTNICEMAQKALLQQGYKTNIIKDDKNNCLVKIEKLDKVWDGEVFVEPKLKDFNEYEMENS